MKLEKSLALQQHARKRIPGLTQLLSKRPDQFSWGVWPGYFSKASGAQVWDLDGNSYIDMSIGGIGATVLGYADADVDQAVKESIDRGVACSLNCPEEVELADLLCEIHPWADMVRFSRTGGESMAIAVRIARAKTGRDKIAFCGYHGWHDWYLAANLANDAALDGHLLPGLSPNGVPRALAGTAIPFRYNQIEELEQIIRTSGKDLAAIVMEPIRNAMPEDGFLDRVRELADESGAVLIVDEISAGFRLMSGGAHLQFDMTPDIAVFSKAIGNGYAIGAVIGNADVMSAAQATFISSTNWTERVGFAAAIATIRKHCDVQAGEHLISTGQAVQAIWKEVSLRHGIGIHIGGIMPLSHFTFEVEEPLVAKAYYVHAMLEQGILASTSFYSMYAHSHEDVEKYRAAADVAFEKLAQAIRKGSLGEELQGDPASGGFVRLN